MNLRNIFIGYEQWRDEAIKRAERENPMVTCPECYGEGRTDCECCGQEKSCLDCDERGELPFNDIPNRNRERCFTRDAYGKVLMSDVEALATWLVCNPISVLVELGYHPYMHIQSKRLELGN